MTKINCIALSVSCSVEQMYQLVNDIESYPKFLPGCTGSKVLESSTTQIVATIHISKIGIIKKFTINNILTNNQSILVSLVDGPFNGLVGNWKFTHIDKNTCYVEFYLNFKFTNNLIEVIFSRVFKKLTHNIIQAFISHAKKIYNTIPREITVEIVYALTEKQYTRKVILESGSTVEQAIVASEFLDLCSDIDIRKNKVGIYNRLVNLTDTVKNGDRVEIYRPLISDPKELRRMRAEKMNKKNIPISNLKLN